MTRALECLLLAGLVAALNPALPAQVVPQSPPQQQYLALDATGMSQAVGEALQICCTFFQDHGTTVAFDDAGKLVMGKVPDGDSYRAARDSGSVLTRASAFRVLTAGTGHLAQLLDLTRSPDAVTRRGAIWLLSRPPEPDQPVIPMVVELLQASRYDPDPLIRATVASLPHGDTAGARDPDPLVRASWWKGFKADQFDIPGLPLLSLEATFLRRALTDQHVFVRMSARLAHERLSGRLPAAQAAAIDELVAGLATDPSPWVRPDVASWTGDAREIGWMNSLAAWIPLPWTTPRTPMGYRDGAVGNPAHLVSRLEYLRSARDVVHLPIEMLRDEPEAELRSTAASMRYPPNRANDQTAPSRLKLIEDSSPDVRLAAVITFDSGAGYPYPPTLAPGIEQYILGGIGSSSRWENHAAIVLARGLRTTHPALDTTQWAREHLLAAATEDETRRPLVLQVLAAVLTSEQARPILDDLQAKGWPVAATLQPKLPDDSADLLALARSLDPLAELALAALIARGPEEVVPVLEAMAATDPRDDGLRAAAAQQFAALPADALETLLGAALREPESRAAGIARDLLKR